MSRTKEDDVAPGLIFLDFDGVTHSAFQDFQIQLGEPFHGGEDSNLFVHVDALDEVLKPWPHIRIVISSSWRALHSIQELKAFVGPLGWRVIESTGKRIGTRYEDIAGYLSRRRPPKWWIAIDDDDFGFPLDLRQHLLKPDPMTGLSESDLAELARRIEAFEKASERNE